MLSWALSGFTSSQTETCQQIHSNSVSLDWAQNLRKFQTYTSQDFRRSDTCRGPIECVNSASCPNFLPYNAKQLLQETILLSRPWALKLQNRNMTTSVQSRNSNCPHLFAACAQSLTVCGILRLQKTLGLYLVFLKPYHINLCSLAASQAYLQSSTAIMSTDLPNRSVLQGT